MNATDIVGSTAESAFAVDPKGRIVAWNRAAERLFGHRDAHAVGRRCHELLAGVDPFGNPYCTESCPLQRMAREGRPIHSSQILFLTASGERVRVRQHSLVIAADSGTGTVTLHLLEPVRGSETLDTGERRTADRGPPRSVVHDRRAHLSLRELEVLRLVADGRTTEEIARRLCICQSTTRNHIQRILRKLAVHSRLEAVAIARQRHLL